MSTITLPNIRVSSDLTVSVRLKDNGVAIDWSTLNNVKASIYSDAQRALAGRCDVSVDAEDPTVLVCQYAANKPQYVGVCRIVVSAKYMGETKTYDKPAFNFVRWTADQDGEQITIDDPDVDVEIDVADVSSSLLDEAIRAAFTAAEEAVDAKGQVLETEAEVEAAEALRVSAEESRVEAEEGRAEAEAARVDEEAVRVSAEDARVVAENARAAAEDLREGAEDDRAAAETARETAEAARVAAEALRVTAEGSRETAEAAREAQASADHTVAAGDHTQAAADHTQAAADHTTAASDHTQAGADHTLAAADHVTAGEDHAQAQDDHEVMAGYDTRLGNVEGEVSQLEAKIDGFENTEYTDQALTTDKGFNTNNDPMPPAPTTSAGTACALIPVTPGGKYRIFGAGGNKYALLWVVTSSTRAKVRQAELNENTRTTPVTITIAEGESYLYVNLPSYDATTDKVQKVTEVSVKGLEERVQDLEDKTIPETTDETGTSSALAASQKLVTEIKAGTDLAVSELNETIFGKDEDSYEEKVLTLDKTFNTNNDPMPGTHVDATGYACFYGIVTPGEKYRITGLGGNKYNLLWVVTDASRNKVRQAELGENTRDNPVTLTIGEGEARLYVCFSSYDSTTDKLEKSVSIHTNGLKDDVQELQDEIGMDDILVAVPDVIDAIVGDTLQLYYRSIFRCVDFSKYAVHLDCNIGSQYPRYYEVTPTASQIGDHPLDVTIKDNNNNVLGTKAITLSVKGVVSSPATEVNVLCVGASGTAGGQWASELKRRLVGIGGTPAGSELVNINFVGSKDVTFDGKQVNVEATGGYAFPSYTSVTERTHSFTFTQAKPFGSANVGDVYSYDGHNFTIKEINITEGVGNISCSSDYAGSISSSGGTLTKVSGEGSATMEFASCRSYGNPFVYDGQIDIQQYADDYCNPQGATHGKIDIVFTELFGNGTPPYETNPEIRLAQMQAFIDQFRAVFPNCKFCIGLMWNPDIRGGMGVNYGATGNWHDAYAIKYSTMGMCDALQKYITDNNLSDYVFILNWLNEFDEENDFRQTTKPVNTRSSVTEIFGVNGVHPATVGYYQLADASWRLFVAKFCQS